MEKRVVELFAGVGGFRVGLNNVVLGSEGETIECQDFDFVWANQWEPSTKIQHAFDCYEKRFGKSAAHSNQDISSVVKKDIPDHTLLVGGFPCQDYSVARSLSKEKGIEGKKGVLWWQINEILKEKRPSFILLENVDRLTKSPSTQRGRDFGIMLRCLNDLGYAVEWRIINAAEYGHPQKRRRLYIFGYHKSTHYYKKQSVLDPSDIIYRNGMYAEAFPVKHSVSNLKPIDISSGKYKDLVILSNDFAQRFENSGVMFEDKVYTISTVPIMTSPITLWDIVQKNQVDSKYFIKTSIDKFKALKGGKKIPRIKDGHEYIYSEGGMAFPDKLDSPGRTMLTSEATVNRSTHVIEDPLTGRLRLITPLEAERMNQFPDNWTNTGMPDKRRYFMMGNALVCGIISKIGVKLSAIINNE